MPPASPKDAKKLTPTQAQAKVKKALKQLMRAARSSGGVVSMQKLRAHRDLAGVDRRVVDKAVRALRTSGEVVDGKAKGKVDPKSGIMVGGSRISGLRLLSPAERRAAKSTAAAKPAPTSAASKATSAAAKNKTKRPAGRMAAAVQKVSLDPTPLAPKAPRRAAPAVMATPAPSEDDVERAFNSAAIEYEDRMNATGLSSLEGAMRSFQETDPKAAAKKLLAMNDQELEDFYWRKTEMGQKYDRHRDVIHDSVHLRALRESLEEVAGPSPADAPLQPPVPQAISSPSPGSTQNRRKAKGPTAAKTGADLAALVDQTPGDRDNPAAAARLIAEAQARVRDRPDGVQGAVGQARMVRRVLEVAAKRSPGGATRQAVQTARAVEKVTAKIDRTVKKVAKAGPQAWALEPETLKRDLAALKVVAAPKGAEIAHDAWFAASAGDTFQGAKANDLSALGQDGMRARPFFASSDEIAKSGDSDLQATVRKNNVGGVERTFEGLLDAAEGRGLVESARYVERTAELAPLPSGPAGARPKFSPETQKYFQQVGYELAQVHKAYEAGEAPDFAALPHAHQALMTTHDRYVGANPWAPESQKMPFDALSAQEQARARSAGWKRLMTRSARRGDRQPPLCRLI